MKPGSVIIPYWQESTAKSMYTIDFMFIFKEMNYVPNLLSLCIISMFSVVPCTTICKSSYEKGCFGEKQTTITTFYTYE